MHYTIADRKQRWQEFMSKEVSQQHMFHIYYNEQVEIRPWPNPENESERLDWAIANYNMLLDQSEWLPDDKIPFLDLYTGTEIFAEAFGCKVHRTDDQMPFALPCIQSTSEVDTLKVPELGSSSLVRLFEMTDVLRKRTDNRAIIRLPDIQSPVDIAALIWEKTEFYPAMVTNPLAVEQLINKVEELLISFLDEWFAQYGSEFIAHYPSYYMNGGLTLSEDEIGALSPAMFQRFCLPSLVKLSNRYGGIGIHCCAHAKHQWENLKQIPNLKLINLVQPKEVLLQAYKFFSNSTTQMHSWCGDGTPATWIAQYPEDARVVMQVQADSREQAYQLAQELSIALERE